jgi:hypothetical protein
MNDQVHRLDNFTQLMARFHQSPGDYDEGEEEDPRPYFSGEKELARFCCVTLNYTSHGEEKYFFLPTFENASDACNRATEYATDDIFEELPVLVVDLDEGREMSPLYRRIMWSEWR